MFDLGFGEILIISMVALLVIGPERLPETVRFLSHWFDRIRRQVNEVRTDIRREMQLEDMKSIHREFVDAKRGAETAFRSAVRGASEETGRIKAEVVEGESPKSEPENKSAETEKSSPPSTVS